MVNYWLVKQEPNDYNYDNLSKEGKTMWDGVHNNFALKNISKMKSGVLAFFYHSGKEKQIVGVIEIISNPYSNPNENNARFLVVDVKPNFKLDTPVTLSKIKSMAIFKEWHLVKISRLSVMSVSKNIWDKIIELSKLISS